MILPQQQQQQQPATDPASASGWDHPPGVASPAGHRRCHWKTSQRLFCLDCHCHGASRNDDDERTANASANTNAHADADDAGSVVCAPIVLHQRFILVASGMNLVVFGTFDSGGDDDEDDGDYSFDEAIQRRIDTKAKAPLTEFPICPDAETLSPDWNDKIIQLSFHEETGILYALSMESCVFQVRVAVEEPASASAIGVGATRSDGSRTGRTRGVSEHVGGGGDPGLKAWNDAAAAEGASQQPRPPRRRPLELEFTLLRHWVTNKLGATCMATLHGGGGNKTGTEDAVCVGYQSGCIEGWNVPRALSPSSPRAKPPTGGNRAGTPQRRAVDANGTKNGVSLRWEGYLHDSIRTLSFLGREETTEPSEKFANKNTVPPKDDRKSSGIASPASEPFLVAIVAISTRNAEQRNQNQPPTSSAIKVLDLERILRNEARARARARAPSGSSSTGDAELSLQDCAVSPSRGAEVMDAADVLPSSSSSSSKKNDSGPATKRVPVVLESRGADAACRLDTGCVAMAFPDGSIAFLSSGSAADESSSSSSSPRAPCWVASRDRQVLLSYPAIGSGQLIVADADGNPSAYLAACLRGGTCYLIPAAAAAAARRGNHHRSIATMPFPNDTESDVSDVYVQSFAAGNLFVDGDLLPVLVYAWPGGIVDVYGCGLVVAPSPKRGGSGNGSGNGESADSENNATDAPLLTRAGKRAIRDLIDNDSLAVLSRIADELRADSKHPLLRRKEWQEFLAEAKNGGNDTDTSVGALTFDALCSMRHQNLRRLLLLLALVTD